MTKIIVNTIKQSQNDCQYSEITDALSAYCLAFNLQIGHTELIIKGSSADARLKNGDKIEIDAEKNTLSLLVSDAELNIRRKEWKKPKLKINNGILYKYAKNVSNASKGCITDNI